MKLLLIVLSLIPFFTQSLSASVESVQKINAQGYLELESGTQVKLMGLELTPEAFGMIQSLIAGRPVDIDYVTPSVEGMAVQIPREAFLYIQMKEMNFPFDPNLVPKANRVMINRLLIQLGAAKVDTSINFEYQAEFETLEADARRKGKGVWSYSLKPNLS